MGYAKKCQVPIKARHKKKLHRNINEPVHVLKKWQYGDEKKQTRRAQSLITYTAFCGVLCTFHQYDSPSLVFIMDKEIKEGVDITCEDCESRYGTYLLSKLV